MISTVLFSLSALCFAAMFTPDKRSASPSRTVYTYYFGDDAPAPLPTWKRKEAPSARAFSHAG